uniref:Uncharacterized protein n=1 Tax=Meloidogyne enterolobii TaxID=390850 RepID=A0A6V7UEJ3_MELEN|nr:unnamed protein product [Meloidogyne enterolobii]
MRFKQCVFILNIIFLQICSASETFDIDIESYVQEIKTELDDLKFTIAHKSDSILEGFNWVLQPEEVKKYLLVVNQADFSSIQNYVDSFGSDKGKSNAGGNAQIADLTSLTMAFGVLDKMMFTEGDLNVVNKYNNKMKHFFEYRERINEIAVNTQIQFLIGQPGQIFKKVGKDIAKSMKLFNTMQKDCKKLFERSEIWKIMKDDKQEFIDQETINIKKYNRSFYKPTGLTHDQNFAHPYGVKLMRVDLEKTTETIKALNDVLAANRKKLKLKKRGKMGNS